MLSAALYQRFTSRGEGDFAAKVLSALRFQFGGHVETKDGQFHVRVTLPGGKQSQVDDFRTESEARRWIRAQSAAWLKMYEGGKFA